MVLPRAHLVPACLMVVHIFPNVKYYRGTLCVPSGQCETKTLCCYALVVLVCRLGQRPDLAFAHAPPLRIHRLGTPLRGRLIL